MGTITLTDENLVIDNLIIDDKEIINYFKKCEDELEENFINALKMGVTSLELTSTTKDVLFVETAFNEMKKKVTQTLEDFLGTNGKLCQYFDENDKQSFISKIQDLISTQLDADNEESAFSVLKGTLTEQIVNLGRGLGVKEGEKEERKKGTAKGKDFENIVYPFFDELAATFEDTVEMTGDTIGKIPGNKKGDLVITLNPKYTGGLNKNIVVEVKDKRMTLTGKDNLFLELDEAMKNRDAQFGIFVWSAAYAADEIGVFRSYPPTKIVCTVDLEEEEPDMLPLQMAYKIARAEVISQLKGEEIQIDLSLLKELLKKAINRIKQASSIKSTITQITNKLDVLKGDITSLKDESISILNEIDTVISKTTTS